MGLCASLPLKGNFLLSPFQSLPSCAVKKSENPKQHWGELFFILTVCEVPVLFTLSVGFVIYEHLISPSTILSMAISCLSCLLLIWG